MIIKLNTVGDALALLEESSEVYISFVSDDPDTNDCVFCGNLIDAPYQVTCLPLDCFNGDKLRVFYSLTCDKGEETPVGILCKRPSWV